MKQGNRKLLSDEDLKKFNDYYKVEAVSDNLIAIGASNRASGTLHQADEKFNVFCKPLRRKMTITAETSRMWLDKYKDEGYSIFDVQNAIIKLEAMYQSPSYEMVDRVLKGGKNDETH